MERVIVEVGSTCTKVDVYNGKEIKHIGEKTIEFKNNYKKENKLNEIDVRKLIVLVNELKLKYSDIYVGGTSIFRDLKDQEKTDFLKLFYDETGIKFDIIDQKKENILTVKGVTRNIDKRVAVLVGGGGSTEITIFDKEIKEMVNSQIGVIDIMNKFPDLAEDKAKSDIEDVKREIKKKLNLPKQKADILVLAGGAHMYFAINSGIKYEKNNLYNDKFQPMVMDIETREKETERYYKEISLDEIRSKVESPRWWYGTRAMCAFVLVVAEEIGAKYIVPTDISMVYGLLEGA